MVLTNAQTQSNRTICLLFHKSWMHTLQKLTPARSWGAVHTALRRQLKAVMLIVQSRQELEFVQDSRFDLYAVGTVRHHHSCLYFTESWHRQCLLSLSPGLSFYWSFSFTDHLWKYELQRGPSASLCLAQSCSQASSSDWKLNTQLPRSR